MSIYEIIHYIFKLLCVFTAFGLVAYCCYKYYLDEDISSVEYDSYYGTDDDVFPVMSICFYPKYLGLDQIGITIDNYISYIRGLDFDEHDGYTPLTEVDYESVTVNISDFVLGYNARWKNGTAIFITAYGMSYYSNVGWKLPYYHYSHVNEYAGYSILLKCFGIEITDKNLTYLGVTFKKGILQLDQALKFMGQMVLFHYPNQALRSSNNFKPLTLLNEKSNFSLTFHLKTIEVVERRNKNNHKCIEDWKNYDNIIFEEHIKSIGCKAPYQKTKAAFPNCADKKKMKAVQLFSGSSNIKVYPPPCREIESIHYDYGEAEKIDISEYEYFSIEMNILNKRFKKIVQKPEINFESLVGLAGGYIGLFLGLAIMAIPEVLMNVFVSIKKFYKKRSDRKSIAPQPTANTPGRTIETIPMESSETKKCDNNTSQFSQDMIVDVFIRNNRMFLEFRNMQKAITELDKKMNKLCAHITRIDTELRRINRTLSEQMNELPAWSILPIND